MLKRASSHLKTLASGYINKSLSNAFNGGFNQSQGKVAAELLRKSPLEIQDSPQEKMKRNPLSFNRVQYPLDLTSNGTGHYILFYAISNNYGTLDAKSNDFMIAQKMGFSRDKVDFVADTGTDIRGISTADGFKKNNKDFFGNEIKDVKNSNSVLSKFPTHSTVTAAIALYMPPGLKVTYSANHEGEDTEVAGAIAATAGAVKGIADLGDKISAGLKAGTGILAQKGKDILGRLSEEAGLGNPVKLATKAFGVAVNPHQEMFFNGVPFRTFEYSFDFWPRNQKEAEAVRNIIFLFKYHMHPEIDTSAAGARMFKVPSEFEIHYAYMDQENEYVNKISRVVCTGCNVSYGNDEQFSTFEPDVKGANPVKHSMTLSFKETEIMTKNKIVAGY